MLESLCQGAGTIHDLNLDGAFPARARYRPRELYTALKATPLFDAERRQWNGSMSAEGLLSSTDRYARSELLGVLVEAQCNPEGARELYEQLKASRLYDPARGQWNATMEQWLKRSSRHAASQLLGVLAEAQCNPEGARELYEQLKASPLYDPAHGQWNDEMSAEQRLERGERTAVSQLLGVLAEAEFNPGRARAIFEKLKATPLYDAKRGQWNDVMTEEQLHLNTLRAADAQLLGVMVEAQFHPEGAPVLYERLKGTPLFDSERGQWNSCMSEEQLLLSTQCVAAVQLLGVLAEATLLATSRRPLAEAVPPLPVVENW